MTSRHLLVTVAVLLLGIGGGFLGGRFLPGAPAASGRSAATGPAPGASAVHGTKRVLYWADPMNPHIHADHSMKDSMGMAYIPVYASAPAEGKSNGLHIDPRLTQNLGVRLTTAQVRPMGHALHSVGTVQVDQNRIYTITPRFSGWIKRLNVRAVGDAVYRGQVLAEVYSPELYRAQQEYLIARQRDGASGGSALLAATRERLRLFGMPRSAVTTLERTGKPLRDLPVVAPESGVVTALNVRQGGFVSSPSTFYEIANLDRVWVNIAVYSNQLPWVRIGNAVRLHAPAYPGKTWEGRLNFLYPTIDPETRTLTARVSFPNPGDILRPGMYTNATLLAGSHPALAVPSNAVLQTPEGNYAMLAQGQGHFLPVQVALGPEADGWVEVRKGLKAGDEVVESAQFLLYSESQFQSVRARMLGGGAPPKEGALVDPPAGSPRPGPGGQQVPPSPGSSVPPSRAAAPPSAGAQEGAMPGMNMAPAGAHHD